MTVTPNKGLTAPAEGSLDWDAPLNENFDIIDEALGGLTTVNVTGVTATPVVMTASQYQKLILSFFGTLTANVTYQIPTGVGGQWIVRNTATGSFTVTFTNVLQNTSVVIPVSATGVMVYCDGTNLYLTGGTGGGGGATGGGSDQIFFENDQVVTTSYTIPAGKNAMTAGPVTIDPGVVVTVPDGAAWSIV